MLSIAALGGRLFFAATAPLLGLLGEADDLKAVLVVQGGALLVLFTVMWWLYLRIPAKYFQVKSSVVQKQ